MFVNAITLIIVLLIYSTHQPTGKPLTALSLALLSLLGALVLFAAHTDLRFRVLERRLDRLGTGPHMIPAFDRLMGQQTALAVVLFAGYVYILDLKSWCLLLPPAPYMPTLAALLFAALFYAHMVLVWRRGHASYLRLHPGYVSRGMYVRSNMALGAPVLVPWMFISGLTDLLNLLPVDALHRFLATSQGQVVYLLLILSTAAFFAPLLIQRSWGCTPIPQGEARRRIESICRRARFRYADILNWPLFGGRMLTAGIMGLAAPFRYLLVTESLLRILSPGEMDAVIAHEIGHAKKKHLLLYMVFLGVYIVFAFAVADFFVYGFLFLQPWLPWGEWLSHPSLFSATTAFFTIALFWVYLRYVFGFFMRNFERQADLYVYELISDSHPLITCLEKIAWYSGQPAEKPNWHHFSIRERIDYLEKCEQDRSWISRHQKKVSRSMVLFAAGVLVAGFALYALHFGKPGKYLQRSMVERMLLRELQSSPQRADLIFLLGNIYYEEKQYAQAIDAYERALALEPTNPEALNNLAWLLVTAQDKALRDPPRALELARKAVLLKSAAHILDTLAESLYASGKPREAVEAAHQALAMKPENPAYYKKQLDRFEEAARTIED